MSVLINVGIKSVDSVLAYNQYDAESEIFMKIPIGFGVEEAHPREWFIILDKESIA